MGCVTMFCPLTITGFAELVLQAGEPRSVADSKMKPALLVGHVKMTSVPEVMMLNFGGSDTRVSR